MHSGTCLCGDVRWRFDGPIDAMLHCHCSMCRKTHGAAFGSVITVAKDQFEWLSGEDKIVRFGSSANGVREFCPRCGSVVPDDAGRFAVVPIGSTDAELDVSNRCHVFVASKASWYDIPDTLPQHDTLPPEFEFEPTPSTPREARQTEAAGGSCLCGDVAYEFDLPVARLVHCHCSRCRRSRSAAHSTQVFVNADQFRWLEGEHLVRRYKVPDAKRFAPTFCPRCASLMPRVVESSFAIIPAGTLDDDPRARPALHIFTDSKAPWFDIEDGLPQHAEMPPSGWLSP